MRSNGSRTNGGTGTRCWPRSLRDEREFRPRAARVAIAVPPEQQRFISELADLIEKTGLKDEPWLLLGAFSSRVERYLAGAAIPIEETCRELAERLSSFIPGSDLMDIGYRLERCAEVARAARARDRRIARDRGASRT
ncbi:hypothetical protein ACWGK6_23560 [Streptomyces violaceusniger]